MADSSNLSSAELTNIGMGLFSLEPSLESLVLMRVRVGKPRKIQICRLSPVAYSDDNPTVFPSCTPWVMRDFSIPCEVRNALY